MVRSWLYLPVLLAAAIVGSTATGIAQEAPAAPVQSGSAEAQSDGKPRDGLVELPPTPMLDEEGRQRLDPDGKPMWNPPVRQQRDKRGHPLFDEMGKPVMQTPFELGYDEHGKKLHARKEKPAKAVSVSISAGTLTVDGMIGKAGLNYDIADLKYIYFYAPWVGTVVVSNAMFPGAKEQPGAFDQHTLTVKVDEHEFQLYSEKLLLGKKPAAAFVAVNREFQMPSKMPLIGYGETLKPPYAWPGAKEIAGVRGAPPVPASLRPALLLPPCPAGQMRAAGPATGSATMAGEKGRTQPCVAIAAAGGQAVRE